MDEIGILNIILSKLREQDIKIAKLEKQLKDLEPEKDYQTISNYKMFKKIDSVLNKIYLRIDKL